MNTSHRHLYFTGVGVALATLVTLVVVSTQELGGERFVSRTEAVLCLLVMIGAAVACWLRSIWSPHARRQWRLLVAALSAWGLGQLMWTIELFDDSPSTTPSWSDIGFVAAFPLTMAVVLSFRQVAPSGADRARLLLDGCVMSSALLLISWALWIGPALEANPTGGMLGRILSIFYPAADVIVVSIFTAQMLRVAPGSVRRRMVMVCLGFASLTVADSAMAWITLHGYDGLDVLTLGRILGFGLVAFSALMPGVVPIDLRHREQRWATLSPYVPGLIALLVVGVQQTQDSLDTVTAVIGLVMVLVLMTRQWVSVLENMTLTRDLEAKVMARTSELAEREARFSALVQHSSDVVAIVAPEGTFSYLSPSAGSVLGWAPSTVPNVRVDRLLHPSDRSAWEHALSTLALSGSTPVNIECRVSHADGSWRNVEILATDLASEPAIGGLVLNMRDVTERRSLEVELRRRAFNDPLTDLANRALLHDRLDHALARRGADDDIAVLVVDLDDFKLINEAGGHHVGDGVLVRIAERLTAAVHRTDTVARLGADEFAVLLDVDVDAGRALATVGAVLEAISAPMRIEGVEIVVHASVGLAEATDEVTGDGLLAEATVALFAAKAMGKGGYRVFDSAMRVAAAETLALEAELLHALEYDELIVHYQPFTDVATNRVIGAEALLRWNHPERGLVPPALFIPVAEQCGLIGRLGEWVLREACATAASWPHGLGISVNLSARQLDTDDLVAIVLSTLADTGLAPTRLTLEVTESLLVTDVERTVQVLEELRSIGVKVAIDDFGTGFSSLSYLGQLPVDELKIDRCFVAVLGTQGDRGVATMIIDLAAKLGLRTVAEGVETDEQYQILRFLGADVIQGYLLGRPMPESEFVAHVEERFGEEQPVARQRLPVTGGPVR